MPSREPEPIRPEPARRWIWAAVGAADRGVRSGRRIFRAAFPGGNPPAPLSFGLVLRSGVRAVEVYTGTHLCDRLSLTAPSSACGALNIATNRSHLACAAARSIRGALDRRLADAHNPFVSPDSRWIGFFSSDGKLKSSVSGGQPRLSPLRTTPETRNGSRTIPSLRRGRLDARGQHGRNSAARDGV